MKITFLPKLFSEKQLDEMNCELCYTNCSSPLSQRNSSGQKKCGRKKVVESVLGTLKGLFSTLNIQLTWLNCCVAAAVPWKFFATKFKEVTGKYGALTGGVLKFLAANNESVTEKGRKKHSYLIKQSDFDFISLFSGGFEVQVVRVDFDIAYFFFSVSYPSFPRSILIFSATLSTVKWALTIMMPRKKKKKQDKRKCNELLNICSSNSPIADLGWISDSASFQ